MEYDVQALSIYLSIYLVPTSNVFAQTNKVVPVTLRNDCPNLEAGTDKICFIAAGDIQSQEVDHNGAFNRKCLLNNICKFGDFICQVWDDPERMSNCIRSLADSKKITSATNVLVMGLAHGGWDKSRNSGNGSYNCGSYSHNKMLDDLKSTAEAGIKIGLILDSCSQGELQGSLLQSSQGVQNNLCLLTSSTYGAVSYGSPIDPYLTSLDNEPTEIEKENPLTNLYDLGKKHAETGGTFSGFPYIVRNENNFS